MTLTENKDLLRDTRTTVLVVEDDPAVLEFISALLEREEYDVLVAKNGVEALDIVSCRPNDQIDILLTDVAMPYMGGIQLAKLLKEIWPEIQVLLISGLPHGEILGRCGSSFRPEILPKPFSVSDLSGKLTQLEEAA